MNRITTTTEIAEMELLRTILQNTSKAKTCYYHLMNMHTIGQMKGHCDLVSRVRDICAIKNMSFTKYILVDRYAQECRSSLKNCFARDDGFIDSIRQQLLYHNPYIINLLLSPF